MLDKIGLTIKKLFVSGVTLRCPNCEQGRMFHHLFRIDDTCEVCGVRFERLDGESIGGMAITMGTIPPVSIGGYFLLNWLTSIPIWLNSTIWLLFIVLGCTFGYRHSRGAWVAVSWVTGGVYADDPEPDTTEAREILVQAAKEATRSKS